MFSGIIADKAFWLYDLLSLVAAGVLLHAALITLNLYAGKLEIKWIHRGGLGWLVIIVVFINLQLFIGMTNHRPFITWWGISFEKNLFMLCSVLLFSTSAIVSSWRLVSSALQVRTLPWAWPSFTVILTLYLSGLGMTSLDVKLVNLSYTGLVISMLLCYVTLFTEPGNLLIWNKLRLCQQKRDWRGWLEHLPLWPTTLILAFCFALLATLSQQTEIWSSRLPFMLLPVVFVLMLLRDVAIVLFFSFSPNPKRAIGTSIIYLAVIYLLLPFLFKMAGLHLLSYWLLPLDSTYGSMPAVMVMLSHVTIAFYMVVRRLKRNVTV